MKLSLTTSYPPYGDDWWGIKLSIKPNYDKHHNLGYFKSISLTLGLGTKRGWDGYQMTRVIHKYGLTLRYGVIPNIYSSETWDNDCDEGDDIYCNHNED